jgi:hypothetical protein
MMSIFRLRSALLIGMILASTLILGLPSRAAPPTAGAIAGCPFFPADNSWNTDISNFPVDPNSINYINSIGAAAHLHPDFGSDPTYGIPYIVVTSQPPIPVTFDGAPEESDPGPYPIPTNAPIEAGSDAHVLAVDADHCMLYELYDARPQATGSWLASSGAKFDLRSNALRPDGWTSADAAGLPILAGLVRYDEVAAGAINHALRFTVSQTQKKYIHPATHYASGDTNPNLPPMGLRLRLKASYDISGFTGQSRIILTALKKYGMLVADNGSSWFISGVSSVPGAVWDGDDLEQIKTVPGSAFEVVWTQGTLGASYTIGGYRPENSVFYLRNSKAGGNADYQFQFGSAGAGWKPLAGDWSGDGSITVGGYNPSNSVFYLRNSNAAGPADYQFQFGPAGAGWLPIAGDWNGDGVVSIGGYNPSNGVFYLRNSKAGGPADYQFQFGPAGAGWLPIAGDWNGDGTDTIGGYNPVNGVFYLRNTNNGGPADYQFQFGPAGAGWLPLAGDWNGDGTDTIGGYNPTNGVFYLHNTNNGGPADYQFQFGPAGAGWLPIAGDWNGTLSAVLSAPVATAMPARPVQPGQPVAPTFVPSRK